ncbi:glycosyltransferase [Specibacter sp. NPDC057265]|uniref:glycosyltransferase n=1 Tax=Specibacter sp. NPDC057265 TaxID=3346075 RepID=UPI0036398B98
MKFSIITIAWNDLDGLRKTVDSVRLQKFHNIEHIVIDGGSEDGTREYLAQLDPSIKWVSEGDAGRYDAMNKGAKMATGDLLWFLHSSDIFHSSDTVNFVAAKYIQTPFMWGHGLSQIVDGSRILGIGGKIPFNHSRFLIGGHVIPHQATVFNKDFFWTIGGYDIDFGLSADQMFMMKASMASVPEVWGELLCDFDALGAGSARGASAHYKDMSRARNVLGISVTGFRITDMLLAVCCTFSTLLERFLRKIMRKTRPRLISTGVL